MPEPSRGRAIADAFNARLADLRLVNGFTTDAGSNVLTVGRGEFDPEHNMAPAAALVPGTVASDTESEGGNSNLLVREWIVEVIETPADPDRDAWFDQAEDLVRDVLQVILRDSSDASKNWRRGAIGVRSLRLLGTEVQPPETGRDYLLVAATFQTRYVERIHY